MTDYSDTERADFNPHSREGSDNMQHEMQHVEKISIHTPAKGVTHGAYHLVISSQISIHTPAKGVTLQSQT